MAFTTTTMGPAPSLSSDLTSLTTSSQIFSSKQYTLPQIRALHKTLHGAIDDKAARLRTQVGGSYRDLLGTADTIVKMRSEMEIVTSTLGRMGSRCGRGVVGGKVGGLGGFVTREGEGDELSRAGRVRLLGGVVLAGEGILRGRAGEEMGRGDRLIVAAKICVLGRLLGKSLAGTGDGGVSKEVKRAERQVEGLRRRLLVRIKNTLARVEEKEKGDVLKALCAYSLPTNSGAGDVLRHFLRARSEAMVLAAEVGEESGARGKPEDVLRCLGLFTKTLQDVQVLFPSWLPEGLAGLKKDRLLDDESLRGMEGLRLDVYERWCGDEIRYFTPFIRHDDLDGRQAKEMLGGWAKEGGEVFLRGLERTLEGMVEFKAIVDLRTSVLRLWIAEGSKARGFDSSVMLDRIREVVNGHMLKVLEARVNKLRLVGSEAWAALDAWRQGLTDQHLGLWEEGSFDMDLSSGAAQFTQDIVARLYGRNDAVSRAVTSYKSWFHVIDDVGQVVGQLRRQRWDNDVEEIEDEDTIEYRQKLLAKEDPQKLNDHLNTSLVRAFKNLDENLGLLWKSHESGPNKGSISMYFLRVLRDIRSRLPELYEVKSFGLAAVPSLHQSLTETVVVSPLEELATVALARRTVVGRSLWEGEPQLPTSPSPGVFRFFRNLSVSMGDAGGDLWSPAALHVLKAHLQKRVCELWLEAFEAVSVVVEEKKEEEVVPENGEDGAEAEEGKEDGENKPEEKDEVESTAVSKRLDGPSPEQRRDLLVQWLFDILYLGFFLETSPDGSELKKLEEPIYQASGLESSQAREQIAKSSQEYWKRTSLLFGLLS